MRDSVVEDEVTFSDDSHNDLQENEIHVRKQNRKGRKWLTTVEGIPESYDINNLLNALKKKLCCSGTIVTDEKKTEKKVLQMQGNHGENITEELKSIFPDYKVYFHGS
ncbi:translation initiation factor 1 [Nematocida sp. LUAm3]|nr:translation initiation factor 1 [Nematocida sp. LUAm3]KAI5175925.1 translation initiation factor 1 [Nematocida sp. LUAm2]KAI5178693.1 translation initiation factor 1 [Nematocida sp. LUAm1]